VSKLKRLLCYESQHQSQRNEKSLVHFDYEKAVSNYSGTQSTFKGTLQIQSERSGQPRLAQAPKRVLMMSFVVLIKRDLSSRMNEARLSHLPFWRPSEAVLLLIKRSSG